MVGPFVVFGPAVTIGEGVAIPAFCHIAGATIGDRAIIGPFARLRPGAELGAEVHIGNFVEVKNSRLARGVKANHLAYIGDATVGAGTNIGAGAITCNYDGVDKYRTEIGARRLHRHQRVAGGAGGDRRRRHHRRRQRHHRGRAGGRLALARGPPGGEAGPGRAQWRDARRRAKAANERGKN